MHPHFLVDLRFDPHFPQHHELAIVRYFFEPGRRLFRWPHRPLPVAKSLLLLFTNRCGSNWLAELLYATGLTGWTEEFFNDAYVFEACALGGITSFDAYIHFLPHVPLQSRPFFTTKLSWDQLWFLTRCGVIPGIISTPVFVNVVRRDRAAQALSLHLALRTGQWKSYWNSGINAECDPFLVSDRDLLATMEALSISQMNFDRYFLEHGITPLVVVYEDLQQDPLGCLDRLLVATGLAESGRWKIDTSQIRVQRQMTPRSMERLADFRRRFPDADAFERSHCSAAG